VWALACILYTLMYFKSPFNPGEKLAQINANIKFPSMEASKYSKELIDLLLQMFKRDPSNRIGIGEVWSIIDSLREKMSRLS
jgi:serine/threonine protein kinase